MRLSRIFSWLMVSPWEYVCRRIPEAEWLVGMNDWVGHEFRRSNIHDDDVKL